MGDLGVWTGGGGGGGGGGGARGLPGQTVLIHREPSEG